MILASGSSIRRTLLANAGLVFRVERPLVDEDALKMSEPDASSETLAMLLAEAKALDVSGRQAGEWCIGSDSIAECDGVRFDKPRDRDAAADHLRTFSGKRLSLISAAALARDGEIDWRHVERAILTVRPLSARFINDYLAHEWPEVSGCVGVFRMEGRGVTLFEAAEGSHFSILGLPLMPLLDALRTRGEMTS